MTRVSVPGVALASWASLALVPLRAQPAPSSPAPQTRVDVSSAAAPGDEASALAEKLQNPIADLYSVPFQNNTNFNVGPNKGAQDILNIQPMVPLHLTRSGT